ncbi:hypothetical protein ACHAWF_002310 [Thalassiosira exigua]
MWILDRSCFMSPYTGPNKVSMILPCGFLLSIMQCGSTVACQIE